MDPDRLASEFESALTDYSHQNFDVSYRQCSSDRFDGHDFTIDTNDAIRVDRVLGVLRRHDNLFAEHVNVAPEGPPSRLVLFVVENDLNPSGKATYSEMK